MIRRPPRTTRTDTLFPTRRSSDLPANVAAAITDKTRCIFVESLANPGGVVSDLAALATIAHDAGVPLIVDNTLASPVLCRPIEHGADIVVQRSEEHTSELQSLMRISYAVFCLKKKKKPTKHSNT